MPHCASAETPGDHHRGDQLPRSHRSQKSPTRPRRGRTRTVVPSGSDEQPHRASPPSSTRSTSRSRNVRRARRARTGPHGRSTRRPPLLKRPTAPRTDDHKPIRLAHRTDAGARILGPRAPRHETHWFNFVLGSDRTGGARPGRVRTVALACTDLLAPASRPSSATSSRATRTTRPRSTLNGPRMDNMDEQTANATLPRSLEPRRQHTHHGHRSWNGDTGSRYYHFRYDDALFLVVDTQDPPFDLPPEATRRHPRVRRPCSERPVTHAPEPRGLLRLGEAPNPANL